jgi:hypothetical protein
LGRARASHSVYLILKLHFERASGVIFVDGLHLYLQMKLWLEMLLAAPLALLQQGYVDWRYRSKCCRKRKGADGCASREYFFLCDSCRLTARDAMWETILSVWVDVELRDPPLLSRLDAGGLAQGCRKLCSSN